MAFGNQKIIGLGAERNFSDVANTTNALNALNLPPNDLNIIRGSANAGLTDGDWVSLSRLSVPIYRTLDRYYRESSIYPSIFQYKAGTTSPLFGNLTINGNLSGQAIRYRYVDGSGPSATIKIADVSSSRVSAWNPAVIPSIQTTPIAYGARVGIITGGSLQFGTPTTTGQVRLQTSARPELKEFATEVPTHKIRCSIGGTTVFLYAMKGIPLVFTGTFRNANASATINPTTPRPNWKVEEVNSTVGVSTFANTTSIAFRSLSTRDRYIKLYYNPDNITAVTINAAKLTSFSETTLSNLVTFNLSNNDLKNFSNFTRYTPALKTLNLSLNPFYLSDTTSERRLNPILTKIPTSIEQLYLGATFFGSLGAQGVVGINSIAERFTSLKVLDLSRSNTAGTPYFHPDNFDSSGYIPNVSDTCETYNVSGNDFRTIGPSSGSSKNVKDLSNLVTLNLSANAGLADTTFSISSNKIQSINVSQTRLPCPDLTGKITLISYSSTYNNNVGFLTTNTNNYKFSGCDALKSLSFDFSNLSGRFPDFTNLNLETINLRSTLFVGGNLQGDTTYVFHDTNLQSCIKLQNFRFTTSFIGLSTAPIHPNAFVNNIDLSVLEWVSSGRTTGPLPSLASCSKLSYLYFQNNRFTGTLPNFSSNPSIYYINLSNNLLSGSVPGFSGLISLDQLYLNNNQLTSISEFGNLPALRYLYLNNNKISGQIPNFSKCPKLFYLILSSNLFNAYFSGSFSTLLQLKYLDISNNQLTQQAVNSIVDDLYTNYISLNRRGVTVNIKNNALPSSSSIEKINFLIARGWTFVY